MRLRHASLALLFFRFGLALITFIASVKYAEWAADSMKTAAGSAVPLIFYSGTIPVLSLIQTTLEIACLHLSAFVPPSFVLALAATGSTAWLVQSSIWTSCELSGGLPAPGKIISTPQWCPQFDFANHGGNLSSALTIFKITVAWAMLVAYLAMVVEAVLSWRQMSAGKRVDEFHELHEIQPLTPRGAKGRPYSSTIQPQRTPKPQPIQILPVPSRH